MDRALKAWEAKGQIGPDDLPLMRMLCRTITEDQPLAFSWPDLYGTGQVML
jgi:hypothetical protein